jgi:hypothetical protein
MNPSIELLERINEIQKIASSNSKPNLSIEALIDTLVAIYFDCKSINTQNQCIAKFINNCKYILHIFSVY